MRGSANGPCLVLWVQAPKPPTADRPRWGKPPAFTVSADSDSTWLVVGSGLRLLNAGAFPIRPALGVWTSFALRPDSGGRNHSTRLTARGQQNLNPRSARPATGCLDCRDGLPATRIRPDQEQDGAQRHPALWPAAAFNSYHRFVATPHDGPLSRPYGRGV